MFLPLDLENGTNKRIFGFEEAILKTGIKRPSRQM